MEINSNGVFQVIKKTKKITGCLVDVPSQQIHECQLKKGKGSSSNHQFSSAMPLKIDLEKEIPSIPS